MKAYRVVVGSEYNASRDIFLASAFHMTFYASDKRVLKYLIYISNCPSGRIYEADRIVTIAEEKKYPDFISNSPN